MILGSETDPYEPIQEGSSEGSDVDSDDDGHHVQGVGKCQVVYLILQYLQSVPHISFPL